MQLVSVLNPRIYLTLSLSSRLDRIQQQQSNFQHGAGYIL